jgi:acyl carrier protein
MTERPATTDEVVERARRALAKELKIPAEKIQDDTDLEKDLGLDSLDRLRMVFAVEEEFGITIEDETMPEDRRFRAVVEALLSRAQVAPEAPPRRGTPGSTAPESA